MTDKDVNGSDSKFFDNRPIVISSQSQQISTPNRAASDSVKNYDNFPRLITLPAKGDIIAYKVIVPLNHKTIV